MLLNSIYFLFIKFYLILFLIRRNFFDYNIVKIFIEKIDKIFIISINVNIDKEIITVSGFSDNWVLAIEKAFSELMELFFCQNFKVSTLESRTGIDVHMTYAQSYNKAYLELIERDSFLMHFLVPSLNCKFILITKKSEVIELQCIDNNISVFCANTSVQDLNYIGLGACYLNENRDQAIEHALIESVLLSKDWKQKSFSCHGEKYNILNRHLKAARNSENIKIMFSLNGIRKIKFDPIVKENTKVKNASILSDRFVVQLKNENLISLSFGELWKKSKSDISFESHKIKPLKVKRLQRVVKEPSISNSEEIKT